MIGKKSSGDSRSAARNRLENLGIGGPSDRAEGSNAHLNIDLGQNRELHDRLLSDTTNKTKTAPEPQAEHQKTSVKTHKEKKAPLVTTLNEETGSSSRAIPNSKLQKSAENQIKHFYIYSASLAVVLIGSIWIFGYLMLS